MEPLKRFAAVDLVRNLKNGRSWIWLPVIFCLVLASGSILPGAVSAQRDTQKPDYGLPELHKINKVTLGPSYSCRIREDFQKGYQNTALFLSRYSKESSPELLFNGACGGEDFLQVQMAGDQMSLIADLGEVPLANVTAQSVFRTRGVHFESEQKIHLNHTYAVLIHDARERGLFVFMPTGYVPNERLDLKYAIKEFQVLNVEAQSPGFDWGKANL